jgi:cell division protein FtsL
MGECLQLQALIHGMVQKTVQTRHVASVLQAVWVVASVLAGLFFILVYVWTRLQVVETGYTLSATRQVVRELEEEHQRLEMEWTALTSPARLAEMAHRRLGLERPLPGQVVVLP